MPTNEENEKLGGKIRKRILCSTLNNILNKGAMNVQFISTKKTKFWFYIESVYYINLTIIIIK